MQMYRRSLSAEPISVIGNFTHSDMRLRVGSREWKIATFNAFLPRDGESASIVIQLVATNGDCDEINKTIKGEMLMGAAVLVVPVSNVEGD